MLCIYFYKIGISLYIHFVAYTQYVVDMFVDSSKTHFLIARVYSIILICPNYLPFSYCWTCTLFLYLGGDTILNSCRKLA